MSKLNGVIFFLREKKLSVGFCVFIRDRESRFFSGLYFWKQSLALSSVSYHRSTHGILISKQKILYEPRAREIVKTCINTDSISKILFKTKNKFK